MGIDATTQLRFAEDLKHEATYLSQMEALLGKMDKAHRFARTSVSTSGVERLKGYAIPIAAATSFVGCVVMSSVFPPAEPGAMGYLPMNMGVGIAMGLITSTVLHAPPLMELVLNVCGRSLALNSELAQNMSANLKIFPGMTDIVSQWGAQNKDGQLNRADYRKFKRWARKAHKIRQQALYRIEDTHNRQAVASIMEETGVPSLIKRKRLEAVVEKSQGKVAQPLPPPPTRPPAM